MYKQGMAQVVDGLVELSHQCDEWFVGGIDEVKQLIADLEALLPSVGVHEEPTKDARKNTVSVTYADLASSEARQQGQKVLQELANTPSAFWASMKGE